MKKVMMALMLTISAFAQDTQEDNEAKTQTLLGGKIKQVGLQLTADAQYTSLNGSFKPSTGGSALLVFNKKYGVGLAAYGISDPNKTTGQLRTQAGYGGLMFEYTPNPEKMVHFSFPLLIGAGMASSDTVGSFSGRGGMHNMKGKNNNRGGYEDGYLSKNNQNTFGIIQPGARFEVNLFKFASIYAGANYRLAIKSTSTTLTNGKLSGLGVQAGIKISPFNYKFKGHKNI